jgi:hypothetical protein
MSGPGDIDGEVSGDEAAWRDLVARFDAPADLTTTDTPWPAQEDLPESTVRPARPVGPTSSQPGSPTTPAEPADGHADPGRTADPAGRTPEAPGRATDSAGRVADPAGRTTDAAGRTADQAGRAADPTSASDQPTRPVTSFALPPDRTRVIRPASDPRAYTPAEEADERFVPAPLPPPARLDSASKAALAGVIGGPGYLLIASIFLHWTISPAAALIAVAAFVGGFVTLVIKLGDRPGRDDDDDGAVL